MESYFLNPQPQMGIGQVEVAFYSPSDQLIDSTKNNHNSIPVVFVLPGFDGNPQWYESFISLKEILDQLTSERKIPPVVAVIVNPTVGEGSGFYVNSSKGGRWRDFISHYLCSWTEQMVREKFELEVSEYILIGHSVGGFGSFYLILNEPKFSKGACLSAIISVDMVQDWLSYVQREGQWSNPEKWNENHFFTRLIYYMFKAFGENNHELPFVEIDGSIRIFDDLLYLWKRCGYDLITELEYNLIPESIDKLYLGIGRRDIVVGLNYYVQADQILSKQLSGQQYKFEVYDGDHVNGLNQAVANALIFIFESGD